MRNLVIDMGNTRIKAGIFIDHVMQDVLFDLKETDLQEIVRANGIDQVMVSSVVSDLVDIEHTTGLKDIVTLTPEVEIPVKNNYSTPHTLGMDRLAAVAGAFQLYPDTNCLVVDAGTTITCDFLSEKGHYQGGSITAGIGMRFKSLADYTDKLPLVEGDWDHPPLIGNNTEGSIRSGVLNGVVAEIEGIIRRYDHKFSNLKVIICGGDAPYFESRLKDSIFAPHLVLIGLNSILMYHVQNK